MAHSRKAASYREISATSSDTTLFCATACHDCALKLKLAPHVKDSVGWWDALLAHFCVLGRQLIRLGLHFPQVPLLFLSPFSSPHEYPNGQTHVSYSLSHSFIEPPFSRLFWKLFRQPRLWEFFPRRLRSFWAYT